MRAILGDAVTQNEIDDAGNTVISIGLFKDNPMTLADIICRNNEREIKWLNFVANQLPVSKDNYEMIELINKIRIFLDSKGLL